MSKPLLLFLILIVLSLFSCGKKNSKSVFLNKIAEIDHLHSLAKKAVNDSTLVYVNAAKRLIDSDKNLPDTLLLENFFRKGYFYKQIDVTDSARYYFYKTIDLVKKPNTRKRNRAYFRSAWEMEEQINNMANAFSIVERFIGISDKEENVDDLIFAYNYLNRAYLDLGNYEKSLEYNAKILEMAKQTSNVDMYVITANAKADVYYAYLNKKEEAFKLLDSLSTIQCGKEAKRQLYRTYGILHFYEEEYHKALNYYDKVLKLSKKTKSNYNYNLLESYNNISEAYIELKDYKTASKYLDTTKSIIDSNSFESYVTVYNDLRFLLNYRTKTDEGKVLAEYKSLVEANRKQHQQKINEKLYALELANEKEKIAIIAKNESELNNVRLLTLLVFSGLLLLVGYLLYRQRRYAFQKQELQMQQRLLRSQMNPHFTFNTLSVIKNQIEENQESAGDYLLRFSRLLRLILENSLRNYVQIENELELLRKYMDLQLLRFPDKFRYTIRLENFEEEDLLFIPPMLIQPFVENSIEHGFLGTPYKGQIDITLRMKNKWITCIIEDNGVGLSKSKKGYKNSVSMQLISKFTYKTTKQKIVIVDKKDKELSKTGVYVEFLIPYKFSEND